MKIGKTKRIVILSFLLVVIFFISNAYSEQITFKSSLIWFNKGDYTFRNGGLGDDNIEIDYSGYLTTGDKDTGVYESVCYSLDSRVTSLVVNWESEGKVFLEVSANAGQDYVSVVNGVPLTDGFEKGGKICWRAKLEPGSTLKRVKIDYKDESGVITGFGNPGLEGFNYRKLVYINNSTDKDLFNYQVKVIVAESEKADDYDIHCNRGINKDFSDIRFTAADGQTSLPYYLGQITGRSPAQKAVFWIKVPHLPKNYLLPIYIYYGNSYAESLSQGQGVFEFFDDFSDDALDLEKWVVLSEGDYSLGDSVLKINGTQAFTRDYNIQEGIIEYKAMIEQGQEMRTFVSGTREDSQSKATQTFYSSTYAGAEHSVAVDDIVKSNESKPLRIGRYYVYRSALSGDTITFQRFKDAFGKKEAETVCHDKEGLVSGHIGLKAAAGTIIYFDWVRVRKAPLEGVGVSREAGDKAGVEKINLPVFQGVGLTPQGSLALKQDTVEGEYISGNVLLPFDCRIFIPSWEGTGLKEEGLDLRVSMTGGSGYSQKCKQQKVYYASKGDFEAGEKLKLSLGLNRLGENEPVVEQLSIDFKPGSINIVNPGLNDELTGGEVYSIVWSAKDYEKNYPLDLKYSLDGGKTYRIIAESVENTGSYTWLVPNVVTALGKVKVADFFAPSSIYAVSAGGFSITATEGLEEEPEQIEEPQKTEKEATQEVEEEAETEALVQQAESPELPAQKEEQAQPEVARPMGLEIEAHNAQVNPEDFYLRNQEGEYVPYILEEVAENKYQVTLRSLKGQQRYVFTPDKISLLEDEGEGFIGKVQNTGFYLQKRGMLPWQWQDVSSGKGSLSYTENPNGTVNIYNELDAGILTATLGFDGRVYHNKLSFKAESKGKARVHWDTVFSNPRVIKEDDQNVTLQVKEKANNILGVPAESLVERAVTQQRLDGINIQWRDFTNELESSYNIFGKEKPKSRAEKLTASNPDNPHKASALRVWFYEDGKQGNIDIDPSLYVDTSDVEISLNTPGLSSSDFKLVFKESDGGISEYYKGTGTSWSKNYGSSSNLLTQLSQSQNSQADQKSSLELLEYNKVRARVKNTFSIGQANLADVTEYYTVYPTGKIIKEIIYQKNSAGKESRIIAGGKTDFAGYDKGEKALVSGYHIDKGLIPDPERKAGQVYHDYQIIELVGKDYLEVTDFQSPASLDNGQISFANGSLDTGLLGDTDNDGFNEAEAAYELIASNGAVEFEINGKDNKKFTPVFKVHDFYPYTKNGDYLLAHYKLDDSTGNILDNAEGNFKRDAKASGDLSESLSTDTAKRGKAVNINKDGDCFKISLKDLISDVSKGTIEFWYKPDYSFTDSLSEEKYLFGSNSAEADNAIWARVYYKEGTAVLEFGLKDGTIISKAEIKSTDHLLWKKGEWVHLRFVWDKGSAYNNHIFYNGKLLKQTRQATTGLINDLGTTLYFGDCKEQGQNNAEGVFDEIYVYSEPILNYGAFFVDSANGFVNPDPDISLYDGQDGLEDAADIASEDYGSRGQKGLELTEGINGKGILYNKKSDYQSFPLSLNAIASSGSLGMWVKAGPLSNPESNQYLFYAGQILNLYYNTQGQLTFQVSENIYLKDTDNTYDGKWHWVLVSWDYVNDYYSISLDGERVASSIAACSIPSLDSVFYIGNRSNKDAGFAGVIDEVYLLSKPNGYQIPTLGGIPILMPQLSVGGVLQPVNISGGYSCVNLFSASDYLIQYFPDIDNLAKIDIIPGVGKINSYQVTSTSPQAAGRGWTEEVFALDQGGNVVISDSETVIDVNSVSGTQEGNVKFYASQDYQTQVNSYTLDKGRAQLFLYDDTPETVNLFVNDTKIKAFSEEIVVLSQEEAESLEADTAAGVEIVKTVKDKSGQTQTEKEDVEEIELDKFLQEGQRPGTELYDVVIKLGDNTNPDPAEDTRGCYKHGDVILIKPAGHQWSDTEKKSFLIIQLYLRKHEVAQLLRPETRLTGRVDQEGNWIRETVKKRAKKIDLDKLGLSEQELKEKPKDKEIERLQEKLKDKVLKVGEVIEEK